MAALIDLLSPSCFSWLKFEESGLDSCICFQAVCFFPPPPSSLGEKGWKVRLPELEQLGGVQGRLMLCSFPSESSQFLFDQPVHVHAGSRMLAVQTLTRLGAQGSKAPSGDQVLFVNIVPQSLQFPDPQGSENPGIFTRHLACSELNVELLTVFIYLLTACFTAKILICLVVGCCPRVYSRSYTFLFL